MGKVKFNKVIYLVYLNILIVDLRFTTLVSLQSDAVRNNKQTCMWLFCNSIEFS